jgi:PilZ domain
MIDRVPSPPLVAPAVRLHAWYGSAAALLRELSRALNQGRTILRTDSGLPVGSHVVLVMSAACLSGPIEVQGTVTSWRGRGRRHEMALRYDFDPGPQRGRLAEAMAELRRLNRGPRREPRVPLALSADAAALAPGAEVTVVELSRAGARLRISGPPWPRLEAGSRLAIRIAGRRRGARTALRLTLELRWVGPTRRVRHGRAREVGGRFASLTPALRRRLAAVLRFDEARPHLTLGPIRPVGQRADGRPGRKLGSPRARASSGRGAASRVGWWSRRGKDPSAVPVACEPPGRPRKCRQASR